MKILVIVTKPPWPPVDGGRLVVWNTLAGLAAAGHRVSLVAPVAAAAKMDEVRTALASLCEPHLVPARPHGLLTALVGSQFQGTALAIARHSLSQVRREVVRLLADDGFDVVQAEHLQALAQAAPAFARGVPVVLRAHNVESDLWAATAAGLRLGGALARREARRLARAEAAAVGRAHATAALTREDAVRLRELASGRGRVEVVRVPLPASLPAGSTPLAGSPALVLMGSEGWRPNRDAVDWFLDSTWPAVREKLPAARLHVYGNLRRQGVAGVAGHRPPADSREIFAPGAVLVVPLRIGSGVRVKILEAWARGTPVVATPQGAAGLEAEDGRDLLVARDAGEFVAAFRRLHQDRDLAAALAAGGRASLAARHDPARVTRDLVELYGRLAER